MQFDQYRETPFSKEIDGVIYTSSKWATTRALELLSRLSRALGEDGLRTLVLLGLRETRDHSASLVFVSLFERLLGNLGDDLQLPKDLCVQLKASALRPTGQTGSVHEGFEAHFMGELPHLFDVLQFVCMHNFAGFTLGSHWLDGIHTSSEINTDTPSNLQNPIAE